MKSFVNKIIILLQNIFILSFSLFSALFSTTSSNDVTNQWIQHQHLRNIPFSQPSPHWPRVLPHLKPFGLPPNTLYAFKIDTGDFQREEVADDRGNIRGRYSYSNKDGVHDLIFQTGERNSHYANYVASSRGLHGLQNSLLEPARVYSLLDDLQQRHKDSVTEEEFLESDISSTTDISVDGLPTTTEADMNTISVVTAAQEQPDVS